MTCSTQTLSLHRFPRPERAIAHLERATHLRDDLHVAVLLAVHLVAHGERRADVRDDRAAARLERIQVDKACADIATPDVGVGL